MLKKTVESFSDEELARLKRHLCISADNQKDWACDELPHEKIKALLARLEAAETAMGNYKTVAGFESESYKTWRKAAGK